jgi:hypothetical protein
MRTGEANDGVHAGDARHVGAAIPRSQDRQGFDRFVFAPFESLDRISVIGASP